MSPTLIDQIYEAAFVPEQWDEVLAAIGKIMSAPAVSIITFDQSKPLGYKGTSFVEAANKALCGTEMWKQSQRLQYSEAHPVTGFAIAQEYYPCDLLDNDESFQLRRSLGLEAQAVAAIPLPGGEVIVLTLEKLRSEGPFSRQDIATLNGLFPHLTRACLTAARLGQQRATAAVGALEAVGLPAAVLNTAGRVLASNGLFDRAPALEPRAFGRLALADKAADGLFQEAIEAARLGMEPLVRSIAIAAQNNQPPTVVHAIPLLRSAWPLFGAEILVVATQVIASNLVPSPSLLTGLFDLEPAEARLAAALAEGKTLKDAAVERGIRYNSARTYLTRILRKTGTRQQSELVALLKSVEAAQVKH